MKIYKNKNFKTRNYECTNVVFCETNEVMDKNWIESNKTEMFKLNVKPLYKQGNKSYYGYL